MTGHAVTMGKCINLLEHIHLNFEKKNIRERREDEIKIGLKMEDVVRMEKASES
jgi:hypothetical protein